MYVQERARARRDMQRGNAGDDVAGERAGQSGSAKRGWAEMSGVCKAHARLSPTTHLVNRDRGKHACPLTLGLSIHGLRGGEVHRGLRGLF